MAMKEARLADSSWKRLLISKVTDGSCECNTAVTIRPSTTESFILQGNRHCLLAYCHWG